MQDLKYKMVKGAGWMVLFKLLERGIGLISTIILARLLVPSDFGLVAIATSIIAVLEIFGAFSFDLALIQNTAAERRHYDTAWTFDVLFGIFCLLGMAVLARPVAGYFSDLRLENVIYWLALSQFINGFSNIGVIAFQKDLDLHKEFRLLLIKKLVGFVVTIFFAFIICNYWALVVGIVVSRLIGVVLTYWIHPYRPRFCLAGSNDLLHFSKWMLINNILVFINNRSLDFVIGKLEGSEKLGLYNVAYEISNLPTTELVYPIMRAVYPGYAKISGNLSDLTKAFFDVFSLIVMFTLPIGAGIAVLADPLVRVILGEKWLNTIPLVQVLALFGILRAIQSNTGSVYLALGIPRIIAYLTVTHISIGIPFFIFLLKTHSIYLAPWAIVLASMVSLPLNFFILMEKLHFSFKKLIISVWRAIVSTIFMVSVLILLKKYFGVSAEEGIIVLKLIALILAGAVAYFIMLFFTWWLQGCPKGMESLLLNRWLLPIVANH